jgi:glycosyltransferase involved in cell wall biosynthesis
MAAGTPVVSTTVGAEGLDVRSPANILLADTPQAFADACLRLLEDTRERQRMASAARELVSTRFSWEAVANRFEAALQAGALQAGMAQR